MYNPDIERHLDEVFTEGAKSRYRELSGKVYNYDIDDSRSIGSKGLTAKGKCVVLDVSYSSYYDCEIYTVRDIDSGETHTVNEFVIKLKEA